jgi:hypothetical protein
MAARPLRMWSRNLCPWRRGWWLAFLLGQRKTGNCNPQESSGQIHYDLISPFHLFTLSTSRRQRFAETQNLWIRGYVLLQVQIIQQVEICIQIVILVQCLQIADCRARLRNIGHLRRRTGNVFSLSEE